MRWRDSTALYIEAQLFNIRYSMVLLERGLKIQRQGKVMMMYKIINNMVAINSKNHFTKPTRKSRHVQNHSYAIPSATKDFRK